LKEDIDAWNAAVARVSKRKKWKKRVCHLAQSFYMGEEVKIHYKITLLEDYPGEADGVVQELVEVVRGLSDYSKWFTSGELALIQMMEGSSMTLFGVEDGYIGYFFAYYLATHRKHLCQSLSPMWERERQVEKPAAPVCDAEGCGRPL